ncbi:LysE/ArgO family amino acid transporter [Grimontia hollisae]|uniref:Arginine exporter protein ArgO n=1 Tax=Grimontia hollisae TaxID=673 RepID=A0A377HKA2_GRIHO|nr:LysE/ArgO family amino acid transporter [Grimontia hollisae]MDF2184523.1 LysE/ArgO family amino acid transporter [Grimontia hollisae]STO56514.1 Arginine exporter protein ArgO [Grimontia hollisae]
MSSTVLLQGFGLGLSMIIPIGAQNTFVLNQGIRRHHHIATATLCFLCDFALIALGVFGGGAMLADNETLLSVVTLGGIAFLLTYAWQSLKSAWRTGPAKEQTQTGKTGKGLLAVLLGAAAVTLLNPHVYLDTVVVLGSIGGQLESSQRMAFAVGTMLASLVWFYGIALGAAKMSPFLSRPKVQRIVDLLVAAMMLYVAFLLMQKWLASLSI